MTRLEKQHKGKVRIYFLLIGLAALIIAFVTDCRIDHGLEPSYSKIGGKIFFNGEIPSKTDEIRVAVVKTFPPSDMAELLLSERLILDRNPVTYEIYLQEGTYDMVAVIWKEQNKPWNLSDIVGMYGGFFLNGKLVPIFQSVTVKDNHTVLNDIDIEADLNRVNRDAKIEGMVSFHGSWPENTGAIGVGAFTEIPQQGNYIDYYLKSVDIDYSLPAFVDAASYRLHVHAADTLRYIAVLWMNNTYDLGSILDIGFYADPNDSTEPGIVTAAKDSTLSGIDITVRF